MCPSDQTAFIKQLLSYNAFGFLAGRARDGRRTESLTCYAINNKVDIKNEMSNYLQHEDRVNVEHILII